MNKYCYRIIFSKLKGLFVVVSELTRRNEGKARQSRQAFSSVGPCCRAALKPLSLLTGVAMGWILLISHAQATTIRVDESAPNNQKPTVMQSANGTTQVNIQTPSKGGVSHNKFSQFDVSDKGVILNNSNKNVKTELGGYVQGNDFLRGSEGAKIILNEVNAANPSQLNGFIEVAGTKAQVVIANASGITCNGCGFINANRATLTTGKPILENGKITGYQVEGGHIRVEGKGFDSSRQDYTDLIAQSVSLNSKVWANNANVITGRNKVSIDTNQIEALADNGQTKPELSVDVSAMGGMYAGKIRMVGTEKGVGVRNTGHLGASASTLSLSSNGKIVNTGVIDSQGDIQIKTTSTLNNSGRVLAEGSVTLQSGKAITQTGQITAGQDISLSASRVTQSSQGSMAAGTAINGERKAQGNLRITAEQDAALQGTVRAGGTAHVNAQSIDANGLKLESQHVTLNASTGELTLSDAAMQVESDATLTAKRGINTERATINAGALYLNGQTLSNRDGVLAAKTALIIKTDSLDNYKGQLLSQSKLALTGQTNTFINAFDNTQGKVTALGDVIVDSNTLTGDGTLQSGQDMTLTIHSNWVNNQSLQANGNMTLTANAGLDNAEVIRAGKTLTLNTTDLQNQITGDIQGKTTQLQTNTLVNYGIIDGDVTDITATTSLRNLDSGRIYGDSVIINTTELLNQKSSDSSTAPVIAGRESLFIGTQNLLNKDHALLLSGGDLSIGAKATTAGVTGYSNQINNHSATIEAGGTLTLSANTFDNRDLYLKLSDTPVETGRISFHEFEWCRDKQGSDGGCTGGNGKRYLIQDANGKQRREIIDKDGNVTGEGYIGYETKKRMRFYLAEKDYASKHFFEYFYDKVTYETQIVNQDPAKLQAGKNIVINAGTATNQDSQIIAGKAITINATQFNNNETKGVRWVREEDSIGHEGRGVVSYSKKGDDWYTSKSFSAYQGLNTSESISLNTLNVVENADALASTTIDNKNANPPSPLLVQYPQIVPITLPDNSLYQLRPGNDNRYLIETDSRFTNRKKWLSSLDYFDSDILQKRLGDGYYEQSLVKEQLISATGKQYLSGYEDSNEQYRDLLLVGSLYAQTYQITPGVALTPEQMAALSTNMVWMVNQAVTLPNGDVEIVSVPKLYLAGDQTGLTLQGSIVHASQLSINTEGDVNNQGMLSGDAVKVQADNITNSGVIKGGTVNLTAQQDITNAGGLLQAKTELSASAGRDLIMTTALRQDGKEAWLDSVATVYVSDSEGKLHLSGQRDVILTSANVISLGDETTLNAGRDIKLDTQTTRHSTDYTWGSKKYDRRDESQDVGTSITTAGNLTMTAGNDVTVKAGDVRSYGDITVNAGNDIDIVNGEATYDHSASSKGSRSKTFSTTKYELRSEEHNTTAINSTLNGDSVTLNAGHDVTITGSNVIGKQDVNIAAKNDVTINAADESYYYNEQMKKSKSGLMSGGGLGVTIGSEKESLKQTNTTQGYAGSTVGSTQGNVNITAGKDVSLEASDVIAQQDINIKGENVAIVANDATSTYNEEYKYKKSGLTVAITGTAADVYEAAQAVNRAKERDDKDLLALQSIKSGLTVANAALDSYGAANNLSSSDAKIGISATIGSQETKRTTNQAQHTAVGSGVSGGHNVTITATGNSDDKNAGDITIIGSEVKGGNDVTLAAAHDVNVLGAANTNSSQTKEKSKGGSVGVEASIGSNGFGVNLNANANTSKAKGNGSGTNWTESVVSAGNKLTVTSGNDTNVIGGQLEGESVKMDVGNDLNIASLQDSDNYNYKKTSASAGVSIPVYGYGNFQANASASKTKMNSNWSSVTDQSGVFAGKGGFDITVNNNTDLKGAVIASSAEDKTKNRLDTGTISFSDIENKANYSVKSSSISMSAGKGIPTASPPTAYQHKDKDHSTTHSAVEEGVIIIRDKDKQQQDINTLSRDTTNANNELAPIFDKQKELDRIEKIELVADIASQAKDFAQKYSKMQAEEKYKSAQEKYNALTPEEKALADKAIEADLKKHGIDLSKYDEKDRPAVIRDEYIRQTVQREGIGNMGDGFSKGIDAATSIVIGIIKGDITGGLAGASAPYLATLIKENTYVLDEYGNKKLDKNGDYIVNKPANLVAHAILGAVVAELQGNSGLSGGMGALTGEFAATYIREYLYGKKVEDLTEAEKRNISSLAQLASGLAVASVGGNTGDIAAAIASSKNAVENNSMFGDWLKEEIEKSKIFWQNQMRETFGRGNVSTSFNIAIGVIGDAESGVVSFADSVYDDAAMLIACKLNISYCEQAKHDVSERNKKIVQTIKSLADEKTWNTLWGLANSNVQEDQEKFGAMLFSILTPSKSMSFFYKTKNGVILKVEKSIISENPTAIDYKQSHTTNINITEYKVEGVAVGKGTTGTNVIAQGESGLVGSKVIQPNTTVKLTESTKLPNGEIVPKGSTVTVSDNTMKITYPDGTSKISNYNKAMSSPELNARKGTTNYKVQDLNKVQDPALDLNNVRQATQDYLKSGYQDKAVSYATASVTVNGKTEYFLSVSGKAWSGNAPTTVNIGGINYKVVVNDSKSIPSVSTSATQTNYNHAEQKLFSYIQDTYKGQKADVNMAVQNTSKYEPGMCVGCGSTSQNFAEANKDFNINIFQGTTGKNP